MGVNDDGRTGQGSSRPARGPQGSAQMYRRRRAVLAVVALLVIGVLVAAVVGVGTLLGFGKSSPETGGGEVAAAPVASAPLASAPAVAPVTPSAVCNEAGIKVTGLADRVAYVAGEDPVLSLKVSNTGDAPCDINVGTSQMEFTITSGDDQIFNSKHCLLEPSDLVKNLKPGASETANFIWKRNRSAEGCPSGLATPGAGGATYVFVATLGKWSSEKVRFSLG